MTITPIAARVLSSIQHQAQRPIAEIAEQARLPVHVFQYQIRKLLADEIIRRGVIVNPSRIGIQVYQIYLSASSSLYPNSKNLFKFLKESHCVNWCAQLGGEYQIGLSLGVKKPEELVEYFDLIAKKFNDPFSHRSFSQVISYNFYPKRYFHYDKDAAKKLPIEVRASLDSIDLDEVDYKILGVLSNERFNTNVEMARSIGVARTTFEYRLKRLVDSDVIAGFVYYINSRKIGYSTFRILIAAKAEKRVALAKLKLFAAHELSVTLLIQSIGPWDFEIVVELTSPNELLEVVARLQLKVPEVLAKVQTVPVLEQTTSSAFLSKTN